MTDYDEHSVPERLGCTLDVPYPRVEGVHADHRLAEALLSLYTGSRGELNAVSQYLYHSLLLRDINCRAASMLECIAGVEAEHFKLIGRLIYLTGGDPLPCGGPRRSRSCAGQPRYGGGMCAMICEDIAAERESIACYERILRMTEDCAVRALLERILLDERYHLELFTMIRSHCC